MSETIAAPGPAAVAVALPVDAVTLDTVEPGQFHAFPDRLTHTKSVPFVIVAQALRGRYEIHCGGGRAVARPGECFLVKPNAEVTIVHRADAGGTMAARWVHLHATLFGVLDLGALLDLPLHVDGAPGKALGAVIEDLLDVQQQPPSLARRLEENELGLRMLRLLCGLSGPSARLHRLLARADRFGPVLSWVRRHLHEPLTVGSLAREAGLSAPRFHVAFREWSGQSPMRYVRELRLAEARRLLLLTDLTVREVAAATGFADQFHFSRTFGAQYGQSPSRYRSAHKAMTV